MKNKSTKFKSDISDLPMCESHKKNDLGYIDWHTWAEKMHKKGIRQKQCKTCGFWLFPEEFNLKQK